MVERLLKWIVFLSMSSDFLRCYVMSKGSSMLKSPSRLLRLCSVCAMHSASNASDMLRNLWRRPGTRWGNHNDFEFAEAVWDIKLEDVRGMHNFLECPVHFLIDCFLAILTLQKRHKVDCEYQPGLVLSFFVPSDFEGMEGLEEDFHEPFPMACRIIWKLEVKSGNGRVMKVFSQTLKSFHVAGGALRLN